MVDVDNELVTKTLEANLKNMKTEFESYPEKLEHNEKLLERLTRNMSVRSQLNDVIIDGLRRIEPVFDYEHDASYWSLQKELQLINFQSEEEKMLFEKKKIEMAMKHINIEIKRLEKEIPKKEKELKEMKGE